MKRRLRIILLNILPCVVFVGLYRCGAMVGLQMPIPQLLITIKNATFAKSKKEFLVYNCILLVSSVAGIYANGQLYFKYICYDVVGEAIMVVGIFAAIVLIIVYTAIEMLYFFRKKKN